VLISSKGKKGKTTGWQVIFPLLRQHTGMKVIFGSTQDREKEYKRVCDSSKKPGQ
jgi:hypothetical protein